MKIAPVIRAMRAASPPLPVRLRAHRAALRRGDEQQFLRALGIPDPDINLEVGSASHAVQTAEVMRRFEPVLDRERRGRGAGRGRRELDAGMRAGGGQKRHARDPRRGGTAQLRPHDAGGNQPGADRPDFRPDCSPPRKARARICCAKAFPSRRIHFVGNVMIDTLRQNLQQAVPAGGDPGPARRCRGAGRAAAMRCSRCTAPPTWTMPRTLRSLLGAMREVSRRIPVVFPDASENPREDRAARLGRIADGRRIRFIELPPAGYLEMLGLMQSARLVLTDSGGMQEETTALGVPCVTLRENTERPITADEGTNTDSRPGSGAHHRGGGRYSAHRRKSGKDPGAVGRPGVPAHRGGVARMAGRGSRAAGCITPSTVRMQQH